MAINLILAGAGGPGTVVSVADGGAVRVVAGTEVRLGWIDNDGPPAQIGALTDAELRISGDDVLVRTPDGQAITLLGYGETLAEQVMVGALTSAASADTGIGCDAVCAGLEQDWDRPILTEPAHFGQKISIDYTAVGDGADLSRVDLYFEHAGDVSVETLFAALEVELGLHGSAPDGTPRIAAVTVTDDPLALSDLVGSGPPAASGQVVFGELPAFAEAFGSWGVDDEPLPVNDNSFIIA